MTLIPERKNLNRHQNAQRAADRGEIRQHEVEKVTSISETLFKGNKGNGQATQEAIALVKEGKA